MSKRKRTRWEDGGGQCFEEEEGELMEGEGEDVRVQVQRGGGKNKPSEGKGEGPGKARRGQQQQQLVSTGGRGRSGPSDDSNGLVSKVGGGKSSYELMLDSAARSFRLSERAKAELVHEKLVQFSEILKIKLRNRLMQNKLAAQRLWAQLEANGGSFFVPEGVQSVNWDLDGGAGGGGQALAGSSATFSPAAAPAGALDGIKQVGGAVSYLVPQGVGGKLAFGLVSFLTLGSLYRRVIADYRPFALVFASIKAYELVNHRLLAKELEKHLNVLLAFEENGGDELEGENVIRKIAEKVAVRHINHVSKLSKSGSRQFASVVVDRIVRNLSRHRFGYEGESLIWYENDIKQFMWSAEAFWQRLTRPADRVRERPRLNLESRCLRALTAESMDNDERVLEMEPFHDDDVAAAAAAASHNMRWTAAGVLSKCGILVHEEQTMYVHSQTDIQRFGFAYGSLDEVRWRRLRPMGQEQESDGHNPDHDHDHDLPQSKL